MKRITTVLLAMLMLVVMCPTNAFAGEVATDQYVEYFEDGSYIVTELKTSGISTFAASTKNYSKSASYYNSDNEKEWTVTLSGTFSYTGSSATCTKATKSYKIYDDHWKVTSSSASKSGNKATGNFTVKRYLAGIPIRTVNKTLTITCSNSGVCS